MPRPKGYKTTCTYPIYGASSAVSPEGFAAMKAHMATHNTPGRIVWTTLPTLTRNGCFITLPNETRIPL